VKQIIEWVKRYKAVIVLALFIIACGMSYCEGHRRGAVSVEMRQNKTEIKALETKIKEREPEVQRSAEQVQQAVVKHSVARAKFEEHVKVVSDSEVSVDGGPPQVDVPVKLTVPEITLCEQSERSLLTHVNVVSAQLADMTDDRDHWKKQAELEHAARPRFGFISGVVSTLAVVSAAVLIFR